MNTPQEKAQYMLWFIETKSDKQTQQNYGTLYWKRSSVISNEGKNSVG